MFESPRAHHFNPSPISHLCRNFHFMFASRSPLDQHHLHKFYIPLAESGKMTLGPLAGFSFMKLSCAVRVPLADGVKVS